MSTPMRLVSEARCLTSLGTKAVIWTGLLVGFVISSLNWVSELIAALWMRHKVFIQKLEAENATRYRIHQQKSNSVDKMVQTLSAKPRHCKQLQRAVQTEPNVPEKPTDSSVIILDVGGIYYKTTGTTLKSHPDLKDTGNMLASMFSGRWQNNPSLDNTYFLDRNGQHFKYVLEYLRNGHNVGLPSRTEDLQTICNEAEYFHLVGLTELCKTRIGMRDPYRVSLNVGGKLYTADAKTLTQDLDSKLGKIFSGFWNKELDTEGCYFFDRDGNLFQYVLQYLRDGSSVHFTTTDKDTLRALRKEAQYYGLSDLIRIIDKKIEKSNNSIANQLCSIEHRLENISDEMKMMSPNHF